MPVSSSYAPNVSTGNGVTTVFAYNFRILAAADLEVSVDGVVQTLTTDYSVSGAGSGSGGNVTFVSAPANGSTVIRRRNMSLARATDYQDNGDLLADVLNPDQDAPVLMLQQVQEQVDRSLKFPLGDGTVPTLPTAAELAGGSLAFDDDGNPIAGPALGDLVAEIAAASASASASAGSATAAGASAAAAASSETNAETAETNAQAARVTAELARDTAWGTARLYASTAAGLAATSSGQYFAVISATSTEISLIYLNSAGSAVDTGKRVPSAAYIDDAYHERLFAAQAKSFEEKRLRVKRLQKPQAAVVVLLGQSNNAPRNTSISGTISADAYMPVSGNSISYFPFNGTTPEFTAAYSDVSSVSTHAEGASETPTSGIIAALVGGPFDRVYACSVAIGSRDILTLGGAGPRNNLYAVVHKLCDHARTAGYEPVVMFDTMHGEADMSSGSSESTYYTSALAYYKMCQMVAAQAMDLPDYDAPIVFHLPIAMMYTAASRDVLTAIKRLATDIPNAMLVGSYHYDSETDRIHQSAVGFRTRGEFSGRILRDFFAKGLRFQPVKMVDAVRSSATVTVTFNQEIARDLTVDYGTGLNSSVALAGCEYTYDGTTFVQITAATVQGSKLVLTLASNPGAHTGTEQLRVAMQATTLTLTAGSANRSGSQIRSNVDTGILSIYDYTYRNYLWAVPQRMSVR